MSVNHPNWGTICCICFEGLTEEQCAVEQSGDKFDVCKGQCALEAGIKGTPVKIVSGCYAPEYGWLAECRDKGYLIAVNPNLGGLLLFCRPEEVRGVKD